MINYGLPFFDFTVFHSVDYTENVNSFLINKLMGVMKTTCRYYTKFDGFVVIHGTDTMAYTASALSFMLENLGKSVILTGSQVKYFEL